MKSSTELHISSHSWGKSAPQGQLQQGTKPKDRDSTLRGALSVNLKKPFSSHSLITPTCGALTCRTGAVRLSQCSLEILRFSTERHSKNIFCFHSNRLCNTIVWLFAGYCQKIIDETLQPLQLQ